MSEWGSVEGTYFGGKLILCDPKVTLKIKRDALAEVRDPESGELLEHLWVPADEEVNFSKCVVRITLLLNEDS